MSQKQERKKIYSQNSFALNLDILSKIVCPLALVFPWKIENKQDNKKKVLYFVFDSKGIMF